jgi:hypothetical protein
MSSAMSKVLCQILWYMVEFPYHWGEHANHYTTDTIQKELQRQNFNYAVKWTTYF